MNNFKLDETGDIVIAADEMQMLSGKDEVVQSVRIVLGTNLNEWFLDPEAGADYDVLLQKKPNEEAVRAAVFAALEQIEQIQKVDSIVIRFERENRMLYITFSATATDGEKIESEVIMDA